MKYRQQNLDPPFPDVNVTNIENSYNKDIASTSPTALKEKTKPKFPLRPGYGTLGKGVSLWANYFHLTSAMDTVLHRYNISISPEAKRKKAKRIVELLLQSQDFSSIRNGLVTDFRSTLISKATLNPRLLLNQITYVFDEEDEPRDNATIYHVELTSTGTIEISELMDYLCSTNSTSLYDQKSEAIQALNIILSHHGKSDRRTAAVGKSRLFSLHTEANKADLGGGLEALRGFFTSVRAATNRLLVNINISHCVFYKPIRLDTLIHEFGKAHGPDVVRLENLLKRVRVSITHLKEKRDRKGDIIPRIKTISGLAKLDDGQGLDHPPQVGKHGAGPEAVKFYLASPTSSGQQKSGDPTRSTQEAEKKKGKRPGPKSGESKNNIKTHEYVSVYDFFKTVHGKKISNPSIPVVNVGTRQNPSYLPAEVCVIMPGQNSLSKLDPQQTDRMIKFAVRKPHLNAQSIVSDGASIVGISPLGNIALAEFGISISAKMITVPARVLAAPEVKYRSSKLDANEGSWNMAQHKVNIGAAIKSCECLWITTDKPGAGPSMSTEFLNQTIRNFQEVLTNSGIQLKSPIVRKMLALSRDFIHDQEIEARFKGFVEKNTKPDVILVILPSTNSLLYNRIKYLGDIKYGVHTVCCVEKKFAKDSNSQYFANVALKFNLKKGGINHTIDPTKLGLIGENKTMIIGIDVTHPSPGSPSNTPSIAGMVSSINPALSQWPAELRIQASKQEMVSELDLMLKSRLNLWRTLGNHEALPENILVYRDGVSEVQYEIVLGEELPLLRKACREIYPVPDRAKGLPRISIVVVGKRHHTRFYPTEVSDASRSSNPRNGTVVDRGVTEKANWDFFLQAHSAIQGTARPAHYFVVHDEIFAQRKARYPHMSAADALEALTHNLCYLFGRATKAVSICPAAYYADLVCERARCYLSELFTGSTSGQSVVSGGIGQDARVDDVTIHNRLRNTMFYI